MRSRALASPFGGAPRRGRAPAFISACSRLSDFSLDKVTDLYVTLQVSYRSVTLSEHTDACDRGGDSLRLWPAANRFAQPQRTRDKVLVHITAAAVTPLDHTILSGGHPRAKAPLVLANEGAGVIDYAGASD